ncbi:MAG TPA: GtrA family protein [Acetobacteraceae bacterium]|nr:GtrA family protein [Acetobacteraceae bacterium]
MSDRILRLSQAIPAPLDRLATAPRLRLLLQFMQFATVGLAGFAVDTAVVYSIRWQVGLYVAGLLSYVVAASVTWALNRAWTFRGRGSGAVHRQWVLFLATNGAGAVLNRGVYMILIATTPICVVYPVIALFAGAVAGMSVNFVLSHRVVFR